MKVISFSLWGQNLKYLMGALKNASLAKEFYPDWVCRFYVGRCVPFSIVHRLQKMENVQVVQKPKFGDWTGMFWRFEAILDEEVEIMICRDTDSRVGERERAAVEEWLSSDKGVHIMRDHPAHGFPVLGGMWGMKKGAIPNFDSLLKNFSQENKYGTDYEFFAKIIYPVVQNNSMIHDEFFGGVPFPTQREGWDFVGKVYDENEQTVIEHTEHLKRHYENKKSNIINRQ